MLHVRTTVCVMAAALALAGCDQGADKAKQTAEQAAATAKAEAERVAAEKMKKAKEEAEKAAAAAAAAVKEEVAAAAKAAEEAAKANYVRVWASHEPKKAGDPVKVEFKTIQVTKAKFDPQKLVGGTAEFEIDLGSLDSGLPKRDGHLKSADYLNVEKTPKAIVKISRVKKTADAMYTARAQVNVHGVTKKIPVKFQVVETGADMVRVKATHEFMRSDFKIGKRKGDPVAKQLKLDMQLTLKKS